MKRKFFKMMSDVARKNEQSKNITCQLFFFLFESAQGNKTIVTFAVFLF